MERCGAVRFVRFSYYKTANCTVPCGVVRCNITCAVVMPFCERFVRFMWFGEHP